MKVALVHDWLIQMGGAEEVLFSLRKLYPEAPIYTVFLDETRLPDSLKNADIRASWLNRWRFARENHTKVMPLMARAIRSFDLSEYDLIVSSSHCVAKGLRRQPKQKHLCYCHSPARYVWDMREEYLEDAGMAHGLKGLLARALLNHMRRWDKRTAAGVDRFIANSSFVGWRIREFYGRESVVIPPPVRLPEVPLQTEREDYFVTMSRLVPYKRIDVLIEAANQSGQRLLVFGRGRDEARLRELAGPSVEIRGFRPTEEVNDCLSRAKAFLTAAKEDFGITTVEALAAGTPVIAYGKSGSSDIIEDGVNGWLVDEQDAKAYAAAMMKARSASGFDPENLRARAQTYSEAHFLERLRKEIEQL